MNHLSEISYKLTQYHPIVVNARWDNTTQMGDGGSLI
jgi:hypothetical protein